MGETKQGTLGNVYYDPAITDDPELELEEDLEYKVETIDPHHYPAAKLEETLNTGWHLYHEIICPPYVILFFSREKEVSE